MGASASASDLSEVPGTLSTADATRGPGQLSRGLECWRFPGGAGCSPGLRSERGEPGAHQVVPLLGSTWGMMERWGKSWGHKSPSPRNLVKDPCQSEVEIPKLTVQAVPSQLGICGFYESPRNPVDSKGCVLSPCAAFQASRFTLSSLTHSRHPPEPPYNLP